ncbi:MAG TPA: mechanosensitive ion channel domain-containing protein, partial [Burkholderiales bacterium]|nr:mechanosensitive ion channel domain-containing protein [Burkholderiales bacterium]
MQRPKSCAGDRLPRLAKRWIAAAMASVVVAVAAQATAAEPETVKRDGMPVKIANRTIIVLRGPISGYTARERATNSTERIQAALATGEPVNVTTEAHEYGTRVLVNGQHAFIVTRIDIDEQAGETTQNVANEAAKRLQSAITEFREQRTPRYLATHLGYAAAATLLYGAVLWLIYWLNGWSGRRLSQTAARRSDTLHVGGVSFLDSRHVLLFTQRLITLFAWVLCLVLASGWLTLVLQQFPYTRPWGEQLEGNLLGIIKEVVLAIAESLPGLVFVAIIFVIARAIIRLARLFFDRVEQGRVNVGWIDSDTARPTRRIFNFVIFLFALAMAYPYLPGAQTEAFKGLSVLAGLMVTIGASSVVGQAFSGLILMYTRAFRAGDYVRIGESEGTVTDLGMFATRIRTGMGEEITLPNSTVMATSVKNYSRAVPGTGCIVDTVVTISYSAPWRQVHAMLEEAARRTEDIVATPAPTVRQTALSDFYVEYRLIAYTPVQSPTQ